MPKEQESQPKSQARMGSAPEGPELEAFRTEFRRLVGGAIVNGLVDPTMTLANVAAAQTSYDQSGGGNYTQVGGDHDQGGGSYDQAATTRPGVLVLAEWPRVLNPNR